MLHPQEPPHPETELPLYTFKLNQKSQFEFVPRDAEKLEFLDLVDCGGVGVLLMSVIYVCVYASEAMHTNVWSYVYKCVYMYICMRIFISVCI